MNILQSSLQDCTCTQGSVSISFLSTNSFPATVEHKNLNVPSIREQLRLACPWHFLEESTTNRVSCHLQGVSYEITRKKMLLSPKSRNNFELMWRMELSALWNLGTNKLKLYFNVKWQHFLWCDLMWNTPQYECWTTLLLHTRLRTRAFRALNGV